MNKILLLLFFIPFLADASGPVLGNSNCNGNYGACSSTSGIKRFAREKAAEALHCRVTWNGMANVIGTSCNAVTNKWYEYHLDISYSGYSLHTVWTAKIFTDMANAQPGHILLWTHESLQDTCQLCIHNQGTNCDDGGPRSR